MLFAVLLYVYPANLPLLASASGKFDADLFYLIYTYFYLKSKISKIKLISIYLG